MDQTICWTSVLISYLLTVFKCLFRVVFIDSSEVGHCEISRSSVDSSSDRAGARCWGWRPPRPCFPRFIMCRQVQFTQIFHRTIMDILLFTQRASTSTHSENTLPLHKSAIKVDGAVHSLTHCTSHPV